jgi:AcrR family transcriptional regulator
LLVDDQLSGKAAAPTARDPLLGGLFEGDAVAWASQLRFTLGFRLVRFYRLSGFENNGRLLPPSIHEEGIAAMKAARDLDDPQAKSPEADEKAETTESDTQSQNRQQMRSQMSTTRLLTAAAELFADRGYRQTTLADIGERAGYSHGLVTRRFGSKQGLLIALLDHMIDVWMQGTLLPAVSRQTGIPGIRAFFAAFCGNARANSSNLKALESLMFEGLWGEAEIKERLATVQKRGPEVFSDLIQGGVRNGTIRPDIDADAVALMASAALRGATYWWLLDDDFDICDAMTAFGDVLEALLRPAD